MGKPSIIKCKKCGMPLVAGTKICSYCGKKTGVRAPKTRAANLGVKSTVSAEPSFLAKLLGSDHVPWAAVVILIMNALFGIYQMIQGHSVIEELGMRTGSLTNGEWYRLITSGFLHVNGAHFASNMMGLLMYGFMLEDKIGRIRFSLIYLFSLIGASLLINFIGGEYTVHVGASGAIFGLMAATVIEKIRNSSNPFWTLRGAILTVVYSISSNVSWQGHLGGGITGLLLGLILCRKEA